MGSRTIMTDKYEPDLEIWNGTNTDMLIEDMLNCIYNGLYDTEHFDEVYTKIVRSHIDKDCPDLMAGHAGKDRINTGAVHYLVMLRLSFTVITPASAEWPTHGFDFMPHATVAVSVHYHDHENMSGYTPGVSINQAALASIIQMARELSLAHHNQPEFDLRQTKYDA